MAEREPGEPCEQRTDECVYAFKSGNKQVAEELLPSIIPAVVRTTFEFDISILAMVSLLHLAQCLLGLERYSYLSSYCTQMCR